MENKQLIYSLTKKDFEIQVFRAGGKGGQSQNKTSSGVRIIHKDSGAVGESRNLKSQYQNKKAAFERLVKTEKFLLWHRIKCGKAILQEEELLKEVDAMMRPNNIKIEGIENGEWTEI